MLKVEGWSREESRMNHGWFDREKYGEVRSGRAKDDNVSHPSFIFENGRGSYPLIL